jgi:hypothetical protein
LRLPALFGGLAGGDVAMGLVKASSQVPSERGERRQGERWRVLSGSWLVPMDSEVIVKCQVTDISAAGARIQVEGPMPIPSPLYFLDVRNRLIYESQVAWKKLPELGLQFRKVYRFAEAPSPALARVIANVLA